MPTVAAPPPPTRPVVRPPRVSRIYHFDPLLADSEDRSSFRRKLLIGSAIAHVLFFFVITILPTPKTIAEPSLPFTVTFTAEQPRIAEYKPPAPVPKPAAPPPKAEPKPEPKPVIREAIPEPAPVPRAEAPKPVPPPPAPAPPKPVPVVKTDVFGGAAVGPPVVTGKSSRTVVAVFGDEVAPRAAGAVRRDRVAEVGFDDAPAPAASKRAGASGTVKSAAFDTQADAAPAAAPKRERPVSRLDAEVEVLSKAKPVYTEEARRLHIEGDVVLNVTFQANGKLLVLGVASGLGHGLDEAAIDAAKKIEFNPARRDGQPVDHTATLRVVFRIA
jgi:TonB family protein